jgi:hypothetical protein
VPDEKQFIDVSFTTVFALVYGPVAFAFLQISELFYPRRSAGVADIIRVRHHMARQSPIGLENLLAHGAWKRFFRVAEMLQTYVPLERATFAESLVAQSAFEKFIIRGSTIRFLRGPFRFWYCLGRLNNGGRA